MSVSDMSALHTHTCALPSLCETSWPAPATEGEREDWERQGCLQASVHSLLGAVVLLFHRGRRPGVCSASCQQDLWELHRVRHIF